MDWRSPNRTGRQQAAGEYVVVHERPFPERLDRGFRIAAAAAGALALAGVSILLFVAAPRHGSGFPHHAETAAIALMMGGLVYATIRMVGMLLVGVSGLWSGKKRYAVEWQPMPGGIGITEKAVAIFLVVVLVVLLGIAKHQ